MYLFVIVVTSDTSGLIYSKSVNLDETESLNTFRNCYTIL